MKEVVKSTEFDISEINSRLEKNSKMKEVYMTAEEFVKAVKADKDDTLATYFSDNELTGSGEIESAAFEEFME